MHDDVFLDMGAQRSFRSDCVDEQTDLSLRFAHLSDGTCTHVLTHLCVHPLQQCGGNALLKLGGCQLQLDVSLRKRLFKYTENFSTKKKKRNFSDKNSDIFHISAQNIDCGYSLEPPC